MGALGWDVTLYRSDLKGEMLQYEVGPNIPASTFNAGRTRHQGVEAALVFGVEARQRIVNLAVDGLDGLQDARAAIAALIAVALFDGFVGAGGGA